ncbi:MAG: DNA-processing protein DprA [Eubacterium sp.]|nr:DNA-processing protein DprA [Eubacterium sp.]
MITERDYLLYLAGLNEIGTVSLSTLIDYFGSAEAVCKADTKEFKLLIAGSMAEKLSQLLSGEDIEERICSYKERMEREGFGYIMLEDPEYPDRLKEIADAPRVLFYKGRIDILKAPYMIAMVGSRQASEYGREAAKLLASELAKAGVVIVSGLAYGIDTASHKGAIRGGGRTIGVSGCGINYIYPKGNELLYRKMYDEHLIISENGLDVPAFAYNFPLRNRIISGLCQGTVVIEAREKSGSLITADQALLQGRNIYAVPGRINDPLSTGTNRLIRDGAMLVDKIDIILEDLMGVSEVNNDTSYNKSNCPAGSSDASYQAGTNGYNYPGGRTSDGRNVLSRLSAGEEEIYKVITNEPQFIDDIVRASGIGLAMCIAGLINLKRNGLVTEVERGYYRRTLR